MRIDTATTVLITGASGGIGEQFARQCAARGADLVLVARSGERLRGLADELQRAHPSVTATVVPVDLTSPDAVEKVVAAIDEAGAQVDVVVNNAGFGSHGRFADEPAGSVLGQVQLNCAVPIALTSALLPGMIERGRGGVLNIASSAAFQPIPNMAVYAATKAFLLSFTEALWAETRGDGIRVLAVCPGATETAFFDTAAPGKQVMTRRQTPDAVVTESLRAFEHRRTPTVVTGLINKALAEGYRVTPRALMLRLAQLTARAH